MLPHLSLYFFASIIISLLQLWHIYVIFDRELKWVEYWWVPLRAFHLDHRGRSTSFSIPQQPRVAVLEQPGQ